MPRTAGRPPVKGGRQNNQGAVQNSATDRSGRADEPPTVGDRFHYACPLCDKPKGTADYKPSRSSSAERWFIDCWHADCQGDDYPERVAAEVGTTAYELIEDPRQWLGDRIEHGRCRREEAAPLPTPVDLRRWQSRLRADRRARLYLVRQRGIKLGIAGRYNVGYAPPGDWIGPRWQVEKGGFTLPVYGDGGELVGIRKRFWPLMPASSKYAGPPGHPAHTYPEPPRSRAVILGEGELDTLVGRSHGLPVVSTTCGASLPEHLAGAFTGRRVAVVYDTGALTPAARTVERLLAAGAREAWAVDLGLPRPGDDLTDWFVTYRNNADALLSLIRRARRSA